MKLKPKGVHPMVQAKNAPPLEAILAINEAARRAETPPGMDSKPAYATFSEPVIDAATLAKPWQTITVRNFSEVGQTLIIFDRYRRQHPLRAGESAEIQMEGDRIAKLLHLARGDRGFYPVGSPQAGKPFESHPVRIVSIAPQAAQAGA
jgi:hypothetical protein